LVSPAGIDPSNPNPPFWEYRTKPVQSKALEGAIAYALHGALHGNFSGETRDLFRDKAHLLFQQGGKTALADFWLKGTGAEVEASRQHSYERAVWKMWIGDRAGALDELEKAERARLHLPRLELRRA
jgi:hypothetical protein